MNGSVIRRPAAIADLDDAADYLRRQRGPQVAIRFLGQVDATFARLASMPGLGTAYDPDEPMYAGLRYFPVSRYKSYLVFYRPVAGGIEVLRILHGARDLDHILTDELGGADGPGADDAEEGDGA